MRRVYGCLAVATLCCVACGPRDPEGRLSREIEKMERAAEDLRTYTVPGDGRITEKQARAHVEAKRRIEEWRSSSGWTPPEKETNALAALRASVDYERRIDGVAAKSGLAGGKQEYDWVILALTNASNRALYRGVEKGSAPPSKR
jgi:hypothetical protein